MPGRDFLTFEYIFQCFDHRDGNLFWKNRPREHFRTERGYKVFCSQFAGKEVGCLSVYKEEKRVVINLNGKRIYRYQIIWTLHYGEWPRIGIDHINRDSTDDRIENLRLATKSQNMANTEIKSTNTSGLKGVSWYKATSKWRARITVKGKKVYLGYFGTPEEAHAAYCKAAREHHGDFAHDGTTS